MKKVRFNLIDTLVVLAILLAIAAGAYYMLGGRGAEVNSGVTVRYQIELANKEAYLTELFKTGDRVQVSEKEKIEAVVTDVLVRPARQVSFNMETGAHEWQEIPGKYDILVTMESSGTETEEQVYASSTPIRVGEEMVVRGKGYAGFGFIVDLDVIK